MAKSKAGQSAKRLLERLRSNEGAGALAEDLGAQVAEVALARELVRHVGEHQATSAGRLPDALAQAVDEAAVQIEHASFLKAVAEQGSKAASSAAKRGLAILRSKGIDVDLAPQGEAVFKAEGAPEELPCLLSTHDAHGDRVLWIPQAMRGGGLQVLTLLFNDAEGVLRVETDELSRKSLRRMREELSRRGGPHGVVVHEVPLQRAKGLVALARSQTPSGLSIEDEAQLSHLVGAPEDAAAASSSEPPLPAALEEQRLRESASLHAEGEARHWIPEEDEVRSLGLKLDEIATSRLYLDDDQRREQAQREIDKAVDGYFSGERGARWVTRLFELSDALRAGGAGEPAERAGAAARALRTVRSASSVPFCRQLFAKVVEEAQAREPDAPAEKARAPGSLIIPGAGAES